MIVFVFLHMLVRETGNAIRALRTQVRKTWVALMSWFEDSETKFFALLQSVMGAVVAGLSMLDPTLLFNDALSPKQQLAFGGFLFGKGVLDYVARTYRDGDPE